MDSELITYYKLTLSHDLLMFMAGLMVHGLQDEDKAKKINQILETWESRVNTQVKIMRDAKLAEMHEEGDEDLDVQSIIAELHAMEPELVRKEFKVEARHAMFRCFNTKK